MGSDPKRSEIVENWPNVVTFLPISLIRALACWEITVPLLDRLYPYG